MSKSAPPVRPTRFSASSPVIPIAVIVRDSPFLPLLLGVPKSAEPLRPPPPPSKDVVRFGPDVLLRLMPPLGGIRWELRRAAAAQRENARAPPFLPRCASAVPRPDALVVGGGVSE